MARVIAHFIDRGRGWQVTEQDATSPQPETSAPLHMSRLSDGPRVPGPGLPLEQRRQTWGWLRLQGFWSPGSPGAVGVSGTNRSREEAQPWLCPGTRPTGQERPAETSPNTAGFARLKMGRGWATRAATGSQSLGDAGWEGVFRAPQLS